MKHAQIIIGLIIISILFLVASWFYNNFNYVSETVEIGYQGEAGKNPLLAAERFLERMGISVESHILDNNLSWYFFEDVLNKEDILILQRNGRNLTEDQKYLLFEWLKAGGHLILDAEKDDALIKKFRITLDFKKVKLTKISPTTFYWQGYSLEIAFNSNNHLKPFYEPKAKISNQNGTYGLFYYFNRGYLTILSDLAFIENTQIGKYDHAEFLWHLVNSELLARRVFLLYTPTVKDGNSKNEIPSLWQLLWTNMSAVIISALLLLIFWLWTVSRHFGPLLPEPPRARRRLLEHIEASGQFLWKQDQAIMLLKTVKQDLLKRIELVHPDWIQLSRRKLSQQLSQISEFSVNEIEIALQEIKPKTELIFTINVQILTKIRKIL
jgi:hypothetical protein